MINSERSLTTPKTSTCNDKEIGKISCEIFAFTLQFPSLPQDKISKIFQNRFRPLSLYKLQHPKGRDDMYFDQIAIDEGTLQIWKVTRSYRDYGNNKALGSEVFLNWMTVRVALFGSTIRYLFTLALPNFHCEILDLAKVYRWQREILPLALDLEIHFVGDHPSDFSQKKILAK